MVIEVQARPDPDKTDVLFEVSAALRCRARRPDGGKFRALPAMAHLTDRPPEPEIDNGSPSGPRVPRWMSGDKPSERYSKIALPARCPKRSSK